MRVRAYEAFLHICLTEGALMQWHVCGDQRGLYRVGSFLPSLYIVPEIKLISPALKVALLPKAFHCPD